MSWSESLGAYEGISSGKFRVSWSLLVCLSCCDTVKRLNAFSNLLQICHSKSGEINPMKVANLVKAYVEKYKHMRKHKKSDGEDAREVEN